MRDGLHYQSCVYICMANKDRQAALKYDNILPDPLEAPQEMKNSMNV